MKKIIIALFFISSFSSFAYISKESVRSIWNIDKKDNISLNQIEGFNEYSIDVADCHRYNKKCSTSFYVKGVGMFEIHINKEGGPLFITDYTPRQIIRPGGLIESAD